MNNMLYVVKPIFIPHMMYGLYERSYEVNSNYCDGDFVLTLVKTYDTLPEALYHRDMLNSLMKDQDL